MKIGTGAIIGPRLVWASKKSFNFWQRWGLHVTPAGEHIPNTRTLGDRPWAQQSALAGIDLRERDQLNLLSSFVTDFKNEYKEFPRRRGRVPYDYYVYNGMFESVDGEILYSMVRRFKPARVLEIGSGNSTYLFAQAIRKNIEEDRDYRCNLLAIEPRPNPVLQAGFPALSKLISEPVQNVPLSEFEQLRENDILFIDSSHVLMTGNDVEYEYLEILPRLAAGVLVHAHDIFLPAEYPRAWLTKWRRFYTEQYVLQAFLALNRSYEVLWASHYMHLHHRDVLAEAFPSYADYRNDEWVGPGSFWIRRVR